MNSANPSSSEDQLAIERLLRDWGLWRDTGRWDRLRAAYASDARMTTTWFDGPAHEFIEASMRAAGKGALVLHAMGPSTVEVRGDRALGETRVTLLLRDQLDGVEVDVTCHGRFIDRLVRQDGRWLILTRMPIYEKDCLVPSRPGPAPTLDADVLARFPSGYRHLAYLQSRAGARIVMSIPAHNSEQQRQVYADAQAWLQEAATPAPAAA